MSPREEWKNINKTEFGPTFFNTRRQEPQTAGPLRRPILAALLICVTLPLCLGQSCGNPTAVFDDDIGPDDEQVLPHQPEQFTPEPVDPGTGPTDGDSDPDGDEGTAIYDEIDIADVEIFASREFGAAPLYVEFEATAKDGPLPEDFEYLWDFGDGATAEGKQVSHTYLQAGTYTVTMCLTLGVGLGCYTTDASKPPPWAGVPGESANTQKDIVVEGPTVEDGWVDLTAGDSCWITLRGEDPKGLDLTFQIVKGPARGTLGPVDNNAVDSAAVLYTSDTDYVGELSFEFMALNTDDVKSNIGIVGLKLSAAVPEPEPEPDPEPQPQPDPEPDPEPLAPVATGEPLSATQGVPLLVELQGYDSNTPALPVSFVVCSLPASGTLKDAGNAYTITAADVQQDSGYALHDNQVLFVPDAVGTYGFSFKAFNGKLYSDEAVISIDVVAEVQPLTASAGQDRTINAGGAAMLTATASGGTPPYTFSWSPTADLSHPASASTFAGPAVTTPYTVTVLDAENRTAEDEVTIFVNVAPSVDAGPNDVTTWPDPVSLSATATDDGLPNPPAALSFAWTKLSGPGTVTFADPAALATTATFGQPGMYVLQLTADDTADTDADTVDIEVLAPMAISASTTGGLAPLEVTFTAVDANGSPVSGLPADSEMRWYFNDGSASAVGNPVSHTFTKAGDHAVELVVDLAGDGSLTPIDTVTVTTTSWENVHDFTGLPMTEDGWTDLLAMYQHPDYYNDSRIIYVSSSDGDDTTGVCYTPNATVVGSDPFNPGSSIQPFKTLTAAYSQLRSGYPDMLLLKRGDAWEESFSDVSAGEWKKSGRSPHERIILATYGEGDRPLLNLGSGSGIVCSGVDNLTVTGIRFFSHTWQTVSPGKGVYILSGGTGAHHQLHEDCLYDRHELNVVQGSTDNPHAQIAFRRCIINNIGRDGDGGDVFYVTRMTGFLFEENIVYVPNTGARWLYLSPAGNEDSSTLRGVLVRRNIFFTSTRGGINGRSGGVFDNNLIVRNDNVLLGGLGGSDGSVQNADATNNVFLESARYTVVALTLQGLDGSLDTEACGLIKGNIFTDGTGIDGSSTAILINAGEDDAAIAKNLTIEKNIIYNWTGEGTNRGMATSAAFLANGVSGVLIRDNDFQFTSGDPIKEIILHRAYADGTMRFEGFSYYGNRYYVDKNTSPNNWFTPGGSFEGWVLESGETGAQVVQVDYPDPDRNLKTYNVLLGGDPSTEQFMQEAIQQSRAYWRPEYTAAAVNAYIREGFGMPAGGVD